MPKTLVEILKETREPKLKYFQNFKFYCQKIKKEAQKILGEVEVIVFGSIVKGEWSLASDIDVLIISKKIPKDFSERAKIRTKIKAKIDPFSPFQIHLATPPEFKGWYKKFLKKDKLRL